MKILKSISTFILLLVAGYFAQAGEPVVIATGSETTFAIPFQANWISNPDVPTHSQVYYTQEQLLAAGLEGKQITKITFRTSSPANSTHVGNYATFKLFTVSDAPIFSSGFLTVPENTYGYLASLEVKDNYLAIPLNGSDDEPFIYKGGHLVLDTYIEGNGAYLGSATLFLGETATGAARYTNVSAPSNPVVNVRPELTIEYITPIKYYTITPVVLNEKGTITPNEAEKYKGGDTPTFTMEPYPGYEIDTVWVNEEVVAVTENSYKFEPLDDNYTISVSFKPIKYKITYHDDNEAVNSNPAFYTVEMENIPLAGLEKTGYIFKGWFDNDNFEVLEIETDAMIEIELWAKWDLINYKITYHNIPEGITEPTRKSYTVKDEFPIVLENLTGGETDFLGWYADSTYSGTAIAQIGENSAKDLEFWAKWKDVEDGIIDPVMQNVQIYSHQNTIHIVNKDQIALKSVEVIDMLGRTVYTSTSVQSPISLNVAEGQYIVRLFSGNAMVNAKVIIKN